MRKANFFVLFLALALCGKAQLASGADSCFIHAVLRDLGMTSPYVVVPIKSESNLNEFLVMRNSMMQRVIAKLDNGVGTSEQYRSFICNILLKDEKLTISSDWKVGLSKYIVSDSVHLPPYKLELENTSSPIGEGISWDWQQSNSATELRIIVDLFRRRKVVTRISSTNSLATLKYECE